MKGAIRLVTAKDAADILAISRQQLWRITKEGKLKAVSIGKRGIRYMESDLVGYTINQQRGRSK